MTLVGAVLVGLAAWQTAQAQLDRSAEIPSVIFDVGPDPQEAPVWVALGTDLAMVDAPTSSIESLREVFGYVASSRPSMDCPEAAPEHWGVKLGTFQSEVARAEWVAEVVVVGRVPGVYNTIDLGSMLMLQIEHTIKGNSSGFDRLMFVPSIGTPGDAVCLRYPTSAGAPSIGDRLLLVVPDLGLENSALTPFSGDSILNLTVRADSSKFEDLAQLAELRTSELLAIAEGL